MREACKSLIIIIGVVLLVALIVCSIYVLAIGVTKLAILGASYFEGIFKYFFIAWFGLSTLSLFYVPKAMKN